MSDTQFAVEKRLINAIFADLEKEMKRKDAVTEELVEKVTAHLED